MDVSIESLPAFEGAISQAIRIVGTGIEVFGVFIIVAGVVWSTYHWADHAADGRYDHYRIRIGRSLLLGLEVLVAADIVKTIAIELTFTSLGLLAGLVVVRTFLNWTLVLEIEAVAAATCAGERRRREFAIRRVKAEPIPSVRGALCADPESAVSDELLASGFPQRRPRNDPLVPPMAARK
jgi:uncharacterized membrane protein